MAKGGFVSREGKLLEFLEQLQHDPQQARLDLKVERERRQRERAEQEAYEERKRRWGLK